MFLTDLFPARYFFKLLVLPQEANVYERTRIHTHAMNSVRARHARPRAPPGGPHSEIALDSDTEQERVVRRQRAIKRQTRQGIRNYCLFLAIFMGIPILLVYWFTPFFVFERLRCRASHKLWADRTVTALESGYTDFFDVPPLYPSEPYRRSVHWGSYEPTRIFALRNRAALPTMFALAWYDEAGTYPVRHLMYGVHNKINAQRSSHKPGSDAEVVQIHWVVHDGIHYGKEMVTDHANRLTMELEFLKSPSGEAWHVRVHATLDSTAPVTLVMYAVHADGAEEMVLQKPLTRNDGGWSPVIRGRYYNERDEPEGFRWRVHEEEDGSHYRRAPWRWLNRAGQPWRVYGLHVNVDRDSAPAVLPARGVSAADRVLANGSGVFAAFGTASASVSATPLNLRDLPAEAFTYMDRADPASFREPPSLSSSSSSRQRHNMVVLKKTYDRSFRLEWSFHPDSAGASDADKTAAAQAERLELSTCQLTNLFRGRDKRILRHARKVVRSWVNIFNVSAKYLQNAAVQAMGEALGSMQYSDGHFIVANETEDARWDVRGRRELTRTNNKDNTIYDDDKNTADGRQTPAAQRRVRARAMAAIGSRTDDPVGQQSLTGTQLLFLVRWNKEVMKDILASWLCGSQDAATGFVPSRSAFTAGARRFLPWQWREEHARFASAPTLLLGLQELLQEMRRKEARVRRRRSARSPKRRNQPDYFAQECAADKEYLSMLLPALRRWRQWWHETQCGGATAALAQSCFGSLEEDRAGEQKAPPVSSDEVEKVNLPARGDGDGAAAVRRRRRPLEQWPREPTGQPEDLLVYRWHGRDGPRLPFSEMDDYPRAVCEGEHYMEAHVDLFSWIALLSTLVSQVEEFLELKPTVTIDWEAHLNAVHWDEAHQRYADRMGCVPVSHSTEAASERTERPSSSSSVLPPVDYSPYTGYVNLYPVMTGTVRRNYSRVAATLRLAQEQLMTRYGLMSVSFDSVRRAREDGLSHDNLWMGYIRPTFNLMFIYSLKTNYDVANQTVADGSGTMLLARQLYDQTRTRIATTMLNKGRWWEFYNPVNGRGEGSKTYIGTHALILGVLESFT